MTDTLTEFTQRWLELAGEQAAEEAHCLWILDQIDLQELWSAAGPACEKED